MGWTDDLGSRGESIASTRLTQIESTEGYLPLFRPHFLGEKSPTFDFLVEGLGVSELVPFFFVQVKTTRRPFTASPRAPRLPVEVPLDDVRRMVAFPAPAYLIGVHEPTERAFVVAIGDRAVRSMPTSHELSGATLRRLWEEVRDYWRDLRPDRPRPSEFAEDRRS